MRHRIAKLLHKIEPWSLFLAYSAVLWCAYSAWFHPPESSLNVLTELDQYIQATLFTLGGLSAIWGHLSGKLFVEELGVIFSVVATVLYQYVVMSYVIRNDSFWNLSLLMGMVFLVVFLLINRIVRIQGILSSKWLKPSVQHIYKGLS